MPRGGRRAGAGRKLVAPGIDQLRDAIRILGQAEAALHVAALPAAPGLPGDVGATVAGEVVGCLIPRLRLRLQKMKEQAAQRAPRRSKEPEAILWGDRASVAADDQQ